MYILTQKASIYVYTINHVACTAEIKLKRNKFYINKYVHTKHRLFSNLTYKYWHTNFTYYKTILAPILTLKDYK